MLREVIYIVAALRHRPIGHSTITVELLLEYRQNMKYKYEINTDINININIHSNDERL